MASEKLGDACRGLIGLTRASLTLPKEMAAFLEVCLEAAGGGEDSYAHLGGSAMAVGHLSGDRPIAGSKDCSANTGMVFGIVAGWCTALMLAGLLIWMRRYPLKKRVSRLVRRPLRGYRCSKVEFTVPDEPDSSADQSLAVASASTPRLEKAAVVGDVILHQVPESILVTQLGGSGDSFAPAAAASSTMQDPSAAAREIRSYTGAPAGPASSTASLPATRTTSPAKGLASRRLPRTRR